MSSLKAYRELRLDSKRIIEMVIYLPSQSVVMCSS